jgi:hypothetical protein
MRTLGSPVLRQDLQAFLSLGVSLALATRDDRMAVELVRCAACTLSADGRVFFAVPVPEGQRTVLNLERTGVVALTAALPADYRTVQLKGTDARRVDWPEQTQRVEQHRAIFCESLLSLGVPEAYTRSLWSQECVSFAFTPTEAFDQTPGPAAGLPLAP